MTEVAGANNLVAPGGAGDGIRAFLVSAGRSRQFVDGDSRRQRLRVRAQPGRQHIHPHLGGPPTVARHKSIR